MRIVATLSRGQDNTREDLSAPSGTQIRIVENTDQVIHLTLPVKRREGELSDAELAGMAGGRGVGATNSAPKLKEGKLDLEKTKIEPMKHD